MARVEPVKLLSVHNVIGRITLMALTGAVALAILASGATAAQRTAAQAIVAQDRVLTASPGYKLLESTKLKSPAQARSAIPKLEHTRTLLSRAAGAVARASASTRAQKTGRKDWVSGARLLATGVGDLVSGLKDLVKGKPSAAAKVLRTSVAIDEKGERLAAKGDKLLGLASTD